MSLHQDGEAHGGLGQQQEDHVEQVRRLFTSSCFTSICLPSTSLPSTLSQLSTSPCLSSWSPSAASSGTGLALPAGPKGEPPKEWRRRNWTAGALATGRQGRAHASCCASWSSRRWAGPTTGPGPPPAPAPAPAPALLPPGGRGQGPPPYRPQGSARQLQYCGDINSTLYDITMIWSRSW